MKLKKIIFFFVYAVNYSSLKENWYRHHTIHTSHRKLQSVHLQFFLFLVFYSLFIQNSIAFYIDNLLSITFK